MNVTWSLVEYPGIGNTRSIVWTYDFKKFRFEVKGIFTESHYVHSEKYECKILVKESKQVLYERKGFEDLQTAQASVLTYAVNHLDNKPAPGVQEQLDMDMAIDMAVLYNRAAERAAEQNLPGEALKWRLEADLFEKKAGTASRALNRIKQNKNS